MKTYEIAVTFYYTVEADSQDDAIAGVDALSLDMSKPKNVDDDLASDAGLLQLELDEKEKFKVIEVAGDKDDRNRA